MSEETVTDAATEAGNEKLSSGKDHARKAVEDLRAAAEEKSAAIRSAAEAKAQELRQRAEEAWDQGKTCAKQWQSDGEKYVRDNPTRAVLTALGVGFVVGLLFRR